MAYVAGNKSQEKDNDSDQAPILSANSGGSVDTGGQAAVQGPVTQSSFTNIQKYQAANPEGWGKVKDVLTGTVQPTVNEGKTATDNIFNKASTDIQTGTNKADAGLVNKAVSDASTLNDQERQTLRGNLAGQYKGPQFEELDFNPAEIAAKKAREQAGQLQSEAGRMEAIKRQSQPKGGTQGAATLDNLLLQTKEGAVSDLTSGTEAQVSDFEKMLAARKADAQGRITQAQAESKQTADDLRSNLSGARSGITSQAQAAFEQANRETAQEAQQRQSEIDRRQIAAGAIVSGRQLDDKEAGLLGLNGQQAAELQRQIQRLPLSSRFEVMQAILPQISGFISAPEVAGAGTVSNYIDPTNRARLDALSSILGSTDVPYSASDAFSPRQQTAITPQFDLGRFSQEIGARSSAAAAAQAEADVQQLMRELNADRSDAQAIYDELKRETGQEFPSLNNYIAMNRG